MHREQIQSALLSISMLGWVRMCKCRPVIHSVSGCGNDHCLVWRFMRNVRDPKALGNPCARTCCKSGPDYERESTRLIWVSNNV